MKTLLKVGAIIGSLFVMFNVVFWAGVMEGRRELKPAEVRTVGECTLLHTSWPYIHEIKSNAFELGLAIGTVIEHSGKRFSTYEDFTATAWQIMENGTNDYRRFLQ